MQTHALVPLSNDMLQLKVASFVTEEGFWNWDMLFDLLPRNICEFIARVAPPSIYSGLDTLAWRGSHDGNFSVRSAYDLLSNNNFFSKDPLFCLIGKWKRIKRVRTFMWQMASNSLITNELRWSRHLSTEPYCTRCNEGLHETILHALRNCTCIQPFWTKLLDPSSHPEFFTSNTRDWILLNLKGIPYCSINWPFLFGVAVHFLWKIRNEVIFQLVTPSVDDICARFWVVFSSQCHVYLLNQ